MPMGKTMNILLIGILKRHAAVLLGNLPPHAHKIDFCFSDDDGLAAIQQKIRRADRVLSTRFIPHAVTASARRAGIPVRCLHGGMGALRAALETALCA